eukprot:TRINITY_DN1772_c0_g1_i2.p1 TRINITY_DN1772_c0_g1~~TRINITY_DN1772_c0_g1_i2.p1  ORF type:complete len:410 (+),score=37.62 TRINITY_DN1772_c0_g1_i2:46-1230(+)
MARQGGESDATMLGSSRWSTLPPELLTDIISRVEAAHSVWPSRKCLIACAGVCRTWRDVTKEIVASEEKDSRGQLTFPSDLLRAGPSHSCVECFIRRNRKTATYYLYLGLPPTPMETGKLLLAARKCGWCRSSTEYVISLDPTNFSRGSSAHMGRLKANFLSTKFSVSDASKQGTSAVSNSSPRPAVSISYALNVMGTRGPRKIQCVLNDLAVGSSLDVEEGQIRSPATDVAKISPQFPSILSIPSISGGSGVASVESSDVSPSSGNSAGVLRAKGAVADCSHTCASGGCQCGSGADDQQPGPLLLRNKSPRWHEQLQCWCLNFRGRVTVASVKNFQLIESGSVASASDADKLVLLQFGKIGKDTFTMDFRHPLSAFQAFAICLSSFDTKVACE